MRIRGDVLMFLTTLLAAAGWLFSKLVLAEMQPFTFLAMRFSLAGVILLLLCWPLLLKFSPTQWGYSALGGLVFALGILCWIQGLAHSQHLGEGAFIVSLLVVLVPLLGRVFFGQKITWGLLLAWLPAVAGLAALTLENGFRLEPSQWFFLAAAVFFALLVNLSSRFVKQIPPLAMACVQLLVVGAVAALAALSSETAQWHYSPHIWWLFLAATLFTSALRYWLQVSALQSVSANHASMLLLFEPVWTAMLGAWWLQERMSLSQWLGCGLIFSAILVYQFSLMARWQRRYGS